MLVACGAPAGDDGVVDTDPTWPGDDWEVIAPEDDGLDPVALQDALDWALGDERVTQAVVVAHRGRVVGEAYGAGYDADDLVTSWSMAKSVASVLVGAAIDDGQLALDDTFADVFPAWADDDRATIDLQTLISMRSGLHWNQGDELLMFIDPVDHLAYAADRELDHAPGSTWWYSSGDAMLLSGILEQATGVPVVDLAAERVFGPLGMDAHWWVDGSGHALTYCCVDATARDLARFGLMAARGGTWGDERIVSAAWLDATTTPQADAPWYGQLWWTYLDDVTVHGEHVRSFVADGLGNQRIYVFPSLDLVVVRSSRYQRSPDTGWVRTGTTMPVTPAPENDDWLDGEFLGRLLKALDPEASVGHVCRDEETGPCGGS